MPTTPTRKTGPRPKPVQLTDSDIFQRVDELYRAIRGYDGVPGMAADVISLKESYTNVSEKLPPSLKQELIDVMWRTGSSSRGARGERRGGTSRRRATPQVAITSSAV